MKTIIKGLREGEPVYWDLRGLNITEGDFNTPISGKTLLDSTLKFLVDFQTKKDFSTEDTEFFHLKIYSDETKTNPIGLSEKITIFDTSKNKLPEIIANKNQVTEGSEIKFKINTKGLREKVVYWDLNGLNITEEDFNTPISGEILLDSSRKVQLRFQTKKDLSSEGTEYFSLNIYSDEAKTNLISSSIKINILDLH